MYSEAVYNYFNTDRRAKSPKNRKRRIPIPKPCTTKQMSTCKACGRTFLKAQNKHEIDNSENGNQTRNIVHEKFLLIWKYAKSFLSNTVHGNDNQKCSFKIITHKSYKRRSLQKEIVSTVSSQVYCKTCRKRKNKNKCNEHAEKHKSKEHVQKEHKCNANKSDKKKQGKYGKQHNKIYCKRYRTKALPTTDESTEDIQSNESSRGKKQRINLCRRSSRSSLQKKRQRCNLKDNIINTRSSKKNAKQKIVKKKRNTKKGCLIKKKFNTNKQKRISLKENIKKINRFASWQYMQHALNSIDEDNPSIYDSEDTTPVYLTFEEYCLILEAIDTPCNTAERYISSGVELPINFEEITENRRTEDVATNTDKPNDKSECSFTNAEQLLESTEEVAINTEAVSEEFSEEVTRNTELVSEITEEINGTNEQTNEITESFDINAEHFSETTGSLDAINDPLSEAIEEFNASIDQPTDTILNFGTSTKESSKNNEQLNNSKQEADQNSSQETIDKSNKNSPQDTLDTKLGDVNEELVPNNSFVDINETGRSENTVDPVLLSEGIEKLNEVGQSEEVYQNEEANEQTETSENSLDTILNEQDETVENTSSDNQTEDVDEIAKN